MQQTARPNRVSRILTELFSPVWTVLAICLVCGSYGHPDPVVGLGWGLFVGAFCAVLPFIIIELGVRRSTLSDRHVTRREQRRGVFIMGISSVICGLVGALALGAPPLLIWALLTMIAGIVVTGTITVVSTKVSLHVFCLVSLILLAALLISPWWLLSAAVLLPAVAWSRLQLRHHSWLELVLGTVLGLVVTLVGWAFVPIA